MSDRKRNILDAATRVDFYDEANPQLKTEVPYTVELFAANRDNIARLNQAGITSASAEGAGESGTRSKAARFNEIVIDLRLVAKTARLIEQKDGSFQNTFTLPGGGLTYDEALERADSFIADAPAHDAKFSKYALTTTFFSDLAEDVSGFRASWQQQADGKRTGVGATADTEDAVADTLDNLRELDRVMKNHYRNDPQKLAEWLTASHIERKRKKDKTPADENPPAA